MRVALLVAVLFAGSSLMWIGGEMHRENCIRAGHSGCSVLPWQKGTPKRAKARPPCEFDVLTGCR